LVKRLASLRYAVCVEGVRIVVVAVDK